MKFTTALPERSSRRRTRPSTSSSPPQKRPDRVSATSRHDSELESPILRDTTNSTVYSNPRADNSLRFQRANEHGFEDFATEANPRSEGSRAPESKPSANLDLDSKNVNSCQAQVGGGQTSKWSKYLS
jgi:hypothetical protein